MPERSDLLERWDRSVSLCLIPARGGSTGVPGKNLRLLGGEPLLVHSIRAAKASRLFDAVHVSTEDAAIAEVARAHGANVIDRPAELARADTPMPPVIEHALACWRREHGRPARYLFLLQPTSPLRSPQDVRRAASLVSESGCDSAMGVFEADDPPQWALGVGDDRSLRPIAGWEKYLSRRQDLPPAYFDGPVYAIETSAFLAEKRFLTQSTRFFVMPRVRAIDIDTEFDFLLAELLLGRGEEAGAEPARQPDQPGRAGSSWRHAGTRSSVSRRHPRLRFRS